MTELQKVQFHMLKTALSICSELELPCYLVCGSALGAVKYGGFIPWDDDVDIAMLRPDYETFLKRAPEYLPDDLFLQNYLTDPAFPQIYTKLRNSKTAFVERSVKHLPIHHGVYIDIFPLDGYPRSRLGSLLFSLRKRIYGNLLLSACEVDRPWRSRAVTRLLNAFGLGKTSEEVARKYTGMLLAYPPHSSLLWCNHGNWQGKLDYTPREWFGAGAAAEFEGLSVTVPANYDAYLSRKYGDWRADLPEEKRHSHHDCKICDLNRSYKEYQ